MLFGFKLILPLMLLIIIGNLLYRYNFLSDEGVQTLTKLLYWVVLPALLFWTSFVSGHEILSNGSLFRAATFAYLTTAVVSWLASSLIFHRGEPRKIAASIMASIRANNLYVGFPVVLMALGEAGIQQASVYIAVTVMSFHIISISGAEFAMRGRLSAENVKKILFSLLKNPLVLSCAAGIAYSMTGLTVWNPLERAVKMLGDSATAIALIALGASLKLDSLENTLKLFSETWGDSLLRFVLAPSVMLFFTRLFNVSPLLSTVTVLLTSMPAAVNCFVLAKGMGMDEKYTAKVVASTTVFAMLAIPVWVMLLGLGK